MKCYRETHTNREMHRNREIRLPSEPCLALLPSLALDREAVRTSPQARSNPNVHLWCFQREKITSLRRSRIPHPQSELSTSNSNDRWHFISPSNSWGPRYRALQASYQAQLQQTFGLPCGLSDVTNLPHFMSLHVLHCGSTPFLPWSHRTFRNLHSLQGRIHL